MVGAVRVDDAASWRQRQKMAAPTRIMTVRKVAEVMLGGLEEVYIVDQRLKLGF